MNSRQRIESALNHKEADRVPIDLNGANQTGITSGAYKFCSFKYYKIF